MSRSFTVGIHVDGAGSHPAAWHDSGQSPGQLTSPTRLRALAARIEAAGFGYATFAGSHLPPADPGAPGRLDPLQQAAFLGPLTSRIGLIPEIPVTYVEPFHTATQLASLDYAASGRAAWLVSAENSEAAARQFGLSALDEADLAAEISDVVRVNRLLWDSWEEDAVIRDLPTGRYLDREKLHYADFEGRNFSVKGPAITPRPPQGRPPVFARLEHASAEPEVVLVNGGPSVQHDAEQARANGARLVIADLEVVLDARGEAAADRLARLDGQLTWAGTAAERYVGTVPGLLTRLHELSRVVDGVRIIPASLEHDLDELRFQALPALLSADALAVPSHHTLREFLGLPEAQNAFTTEGVAA